MNENKHNIETFAVIDIRLFSGNTCVSICEKRSYQSSGHHCSSIASMYFAFNCLVMGFFGCNLLWLLTINHWFYYCWIPLIDLYALFTVGPGYGIGPRGFAWNRNAVCLENIYKRCQSDATHAFRHSGISYFLIEIIKHFPLNLRCSTPCFFQFIQFVAATQPLNSLAFVFDGINFGASDFAYTAYSMASPTTIYVLFLTRENESSIFHFCLNLMATLVF